MPRGPGAPSLLPGCQEPRPIGSKRAQLLWLLLTSTGFSRVGGFLLVPRPGPRLGERPQMSQEIPKQASRRGLPITFDRHYLRPPLRSTAITLDRHYVGPRLRWTGSNAKMCDALS